MWTGVLKSEILEQLHLLVMKKYRETIGIEYEIIGWDQIIQKLILGLPESKMMLIMEKLMVLQKQ